MLSIEDRTHAKPAPTDLPILDAIKQRWSPRAFAPNPIETDKLLTILEAGRWAASSYNRQPWRFIIARREHSDAFEPMLNVLGEWNRKWAQNAGVIGVAVAQIQTDDGDRNGHAEHDTGMALAHMALQATELGIYMHMIGGFSQERARETYTIPEGSRPLTAFALGYPGNVEDLPDRMRQREQQPRQRKPMSDLVFTGKWNHSADFVRSNEDNESTSES